ncbi:unnamed protein product, partial [Tenebrio molitor]
ERDIYGRDKRHLIWMNIISCTVQFAGIGECFARVNFIRRASVPVLKDSEFKCG